jgi:hypothetical protein
MGSKGICESCFESWEWGGTNKARCFVYRLILNLTLASPSSPLVLRKTLIFVASEQQAQCRAFSPAPLRSCSSSSSPSSRLQEPIPVLRRQNGTSPVSLPVQRCRVSSTRMKRIWQFDFTGFFCFFSHRFHWPCSRRFIVGRMLCPFPLLDDFCLCWLVRSFEESDCSWRYCAFVCCGGAFGGEGVEGCRKLE